MADFFYDELFLCGGGGGVVEGLHHLEGDEAVGCAVDEENRQTGTADGLEGTGFLEGEAGAVLADEVGDVEQRMRGKREELVQLQGE